MKPKTKKILKAAEDLEEAAKYYRVVLTENLEWCGLPIMDAQNNLQRKAKAFLEILDEK